MAVELDELQTILTKLECRTNYKINKITEYMLPGLKEPFYLQSEGRYPQLVVRPAYEVFLPELGSIKGVHAKDNYYHNNEMTRFPKRKHKLRNDVHFGLAFSFDTEKSVKLFVGKIIAIVSGG